MKDDSVDEVVQTMLVEARQDVAHSDQKAAMLIAAVGIGISVALTGLLAGDVRMDKLAQAGLWVWIVGGVFAVGAVIGAAVAVWPDLGPRSRKRQITGWQQLRGIETHDRLVDAVRDAGVQESERAPRELLALSVILHRKYRALQLAILSAGVSGFALAIAAFRIY